ncbi:MAG: helix-turn-helix domain-containing protein [Candidatus Aminicenantes bacterium]|nr:helix-turn-helix domain-containing protein [Candidatus Aminicenantes bacterium]
MNSSGSVKNLLFSIIIIVFFFFHMPALDPGKALDHCLFDEWKIADGLPSDTVNAIAQGPDGYLWIGTTKGLVRFDGLEFELFRESEDSEQKHDDWITCLFLDKQGVLWIGSRHGLRRYKDRRFENFTGGKDLLANNFITCIDEDIKGRLWVGTDAGYLKRLEEGTFTTYDAAKGLPGKKIASIFEDNSGVLWLGAAAAGLFKLKEERFKKVNIEGLGRIYSINTVYEDRKGVRWRGTNKGLIEIRYEATRLYTTVIGKIANNDIKAILEDSHGSLWVGTANGISRLKKERPRKVEIENHFRNIVVTCLFEDREKNIWIGTDGSGLKRLREGLFTTYTAAHGLPNSYIHSLWEDRDRDIWIGAGYGLCHLRAGVFIPFPTKLDNPKKAICTDYSGNVWVGTGGSGLSRIKDEEVYKYPLPGSGLVSSFITVLFLDSYKRLWVGTDKGLNRFENDSFTAFTSSSGLSANHINSIFEDSRFNTWIGTGAGLNFVKNGDFKQGVKVYLPGVPVSCIYEDSEEVSWIGTYGQGLKRYKEGKFFSYTTANGLHSNNIYKIIEDEQGNFWISSDSGVLKVSRGNLDAFAAGQTSGIDCTAFGLADGLKSVECSDSAVNSALQTVDGKIWFATKKGVSVIEPRKIKINKLPPPVIIESILCNSETIPRQLWTGNFKIKGNKKNRLVFSFTATTFIAPGKVKFKYRLEGYDKDWRYSASGKDRTAAYPALPPGSYSFRVTACNSDGVWNKGGETLTFKLRLSFFRTTFFKILVFVFILTLLTAAYLLHRKNIFRREEKYKGSHLDPVKAEESLKKLLHLLEVKKVYRDENISLQLLSGKVGIPSHYLSQVINERMDKNFIGLINSYRVQEAKKKLVDPKAAHLSILGIAFEVGFNSKAAFNRAFKKYTGMTPSEYRKKRR